MGVDTALAGGDSEHLTVHWSSRVSTYASSPDEAISPRRSGFVDATFPDLAQLVRIKDGLGNSRSPELHRNRPDGEMADQSQRHKSMRPSRIRKDE